MRWAAGLLLLVFCSAHGMAALSWAARRYPVSPRAASGVPRWALWTWFAVTQIGSFAAVRVIEGRSIGLAIAACAIGAICARAVATDIWLSGRPTISHHAIRIAVATGILTLTVLAL